MIMIETEFITFHLTTNILAMEFIPLYGTADNDIDWHEIHSIVFEHKVSGLKSNRPVHSTGRLLFGINRPVLQIVWNNFADMC